MAVRFILGRAGAGKTRACLDAVLSELARPDEARRLILLVPEQASFQMERALAVRAPGGGYTRAAVLSFTRLARRVFAETGSEPEMLSPQARALALRRVAVQSQGEFPVLRKAMRTGGFFVELDRLIEELLREDVSPEALRAAADRLDDAAAGKVREVAQLYEGYLRWLGPERTDSAARLAVLRSRLEKLGWLREASIWVDGFAGFTGQELRTLAELARTARDLTITLLLDPASGGMAALGGMAAALGGHAIDSLSLFRRTEVTYQRLLRLLDETGVSVAPPVNLQPPTLPRFTQAPSLTKLEAGLVTPLGVAVDSCERSNEISATSDVNLLECATHRDELRAAARWIRTRIADSRGGLRFRDFAVITRDLEPLAETVAEIFAEYEIPYFLDRRRPMRAHPLSRLVPALFEAARTDFDASAMVRLLRTRLLPLSRDQAEQLENIVVKGAMRGAALWRQPVWEIEPGDAAVDAFPAERARMVAGLQPLLTLVEGGTSPTGATWAATLHEVVEKLDVRQRVESWIAEARSSRRWESAEVHRLAWEALCSVLDDLHDVLGDTPLSAGDAEGIVAAGLAEGTLGLAPPTVDQVLVSSIERSRHPDIKYAWVFAFNEGVFPARPAEDLLLSTVERDALARAGLAAPASHREDALGERLLAYIALTRPSLGLTISYATVAEDGEPLMPSPLLADVLRALPELVPARADEHAPPVCLSELAWAYLAEQQRGLRRLYERLCERVGSDSSHAARLTWLLRGVDQRNDPALVGNYRAGNAGVVWNGSPSEVETYLQCPFKHFATYGLRLDPARGPLPVRWDLGSVAHEILARVTRGAMREPGGVRTVSDERWQELLREAAQEFWRRQPADLADRRPDFIFLGEVLTALLGDMVVVHAARWRRGGFEPLYCEQLFDTPTSATGGRRYRPASADSAWPAVELPLPDGRRVRLHGKIDRVDTCRTENRTLVLVYDYKSTAGRVGGEFLTGARLQLFVYLLAAQQALTGDEDMAAQSRGHATNPTTRPAGVLFAPLYPDLKVLENQYAAAAPPLDQLMYMYRPRGMFDESAACSLDGQHGTGHSPVAQMQRKKDGGFYRNSDVVDAAQIEQRLELARRTVLFAAEGVARGAIEVAPLVEADTLACRNCDFAAVCRFDRAFNRPRAAEHTLPHLAPDQAGEGEPA